GWRSSLRGQPDMENSALPPSPRTDVPAVGRRSRPGPDTGKRLAQRARAYGVPALLFGLFIVEVGVPLVMAVLWSLVDPEHPWSFPDAFPRYLSLYQWQYV